jgi:hypothetical protein
VGAESVVEYTQDEINDLISCPKEIVDSPKRAATSVQGSRRNDMVVQNGADGRFRVFMRQSEKFLDDFSIGLRYEPKDAPPIILLRCNGRHGEFLGGEADHPHFGYHIHRAKVVNLQKGLRAERGGELTDEYVSFEEALRYFLSATGIQWTDEHFPGLRQRLLGIFDDQQDDN